MVTDATGQYVARVGDSYPFHQVDRGRELIASEAAYAAGLSPPVVYSSPGITVFPFLAARTFSEADVRQDWRKCLDLLVRCHRDMKHRITGQGAIFWVFQILRDYGQTLVSSQHRLAREVPAWMTIADELEAAQIPLPIIFGHHDVLPSNFLDDGVRLWLIDWEYGAFGTAMFDLANLAANNSFDAGLEKQMLETYFDKPLTHETYRAFMAMKAASALREALWGMISEIHLNAPGVDYVAYAQEYLTRFNQIHTSYKAHFS